MSERADQRGKRVLVAPEVAGAGSRKTKGPVLKRRALKTTMSLHFNDLFFGCALPFKSVRLQVCGPRAHGGQPHRAKGALKASRTRVACAGRTRGHFRRLFSSTSPKFYIHNLITNIHVDITFMDI